MNIAIQSVHVRNISWLCFSGHINLNCNAKLQVRETSRKPDEMYSLLERLSPGTRKLEIFARSHNLQPGWVGLGNQLNGTKIMEPEMLQRYEAKYGLVKNLPK